MAVKFVKKLAGYDEATGETLLMPGQEGSADYRYFPEPDLPIFEIDDSWIEAVSSDLPAFQKRTSISTRQTLDCQDYDAKQLTAQ